MAFQPLFIPCDTVCVQQSPSLVTHNVHLAQIPNVALSPLNCPSDVSQAGAGIIPASAGGAGGSSSMMEDADA